MANEVKLLTADEIREMREDAAVWRQHGTIVVDTEAAERRWEPWRIAATLEALAALAHERLEALIDAQAERDEARMDQSALSALAENLLARARDAERGSCPPASKRGRAAGLREAVRELRRWQEEKRGG